MKNKPNYKKGVVVFSGGQDSTTCLGLALKECEEVACIGFRYGQRHAVELVQGRKICMDHNLRFEIVDAPALGELVTSALTGEGDTGDAHPHKEGLPASFVPARNALFLTLAHGFAQEIGAGLIYTGVCQTDYSGYPDCREEFVKQLSAALNTGYETAIKIKTPLMHLTKAQTFALADKTGFLTTVIADSHTCYEGNREKHHPWGYGCGKCPACLLRKKGYEEFIIQKGTSDK